MYISLLAMFSSTVIMIATATQLEYIAWLCITNLRSVDAKCNHITFITDVHSDLSSKVARYDKFTQVNRGLSCTKPCDMHSPVTHYKTSVFTGKL